MSFKKQHCARATSLAEQSTSKFRLGAVLVKHNFVLGASTNYMAKTHPAMERYRRGAAYTVGLHAEVAACLGVELDDLEGATIYVARVLRDGSLALAKPCEVCAHFLWAVGIKQVYYSTGDAKWDSWGVYNYSSSH